MSATILHSSVPEKSNVRISEGADGGLYHSYVSLDQREHVRRGGGAIEGADGALCAGYKVEDYLDNGGKGRVAIADNCGAEHEFFSASTEMKLQYGDAQAYPVTCPSTVVRMPSRIESPVETASRASAHPAVPSWRGTTSRVGAVSGDRHEVSPSTSSVRKRKEL